MQSVEAHITAIYTEPQFREQVRYLLRRSISRSRLYQLRNEFDGCTEDLTYDYARALAYYAKQRHNRVDPWTAKQKTINFCREYGL